MRIWIWLIPVVSVWAFIYDGFYVGITDTGRMLLATFLATVFFIVAAFVRIGPSGLDLCVSSNKILWFAFISYLLLRGLVLSMLWKRSLSRRMKVQIEESNKTL